jgi:eukaryotic translation initiation factor 2C
MGYMMSACNFNDKATLVNRLQPEKDRYGNTKESKWFAQVSKKIQGLRVAPNYEGCPMKMKTFTVKGMMQAKAKDYMFDYLDKATGKSTRISLQEYFLRRYNLRLEYPNMLLIETQKAEVIYPAEFLVIKGLQRYRYKLSDVESAAMIQWCASRPPKRLANARQSKELLQHKDDPILKLYGMLISESMIKTKARLLPSPEIQFGGNRKHNPGHTGSWDLRGKKFYKGNEKALSRWGVGFFAGHRRSITHDQTLQWSDQFVKMYKSMGGDIASAPVVKALNEDIGSSVKKLYDEIASRFRGEPQLMVFIVPDKDSWVYLRIKKSADCRYGTPSQVLQAAHCISNKPQYHANVLMKVNAKLGGITARAVPKTRGSSLRPGSMIIGADVTHPMMGVWTPSLAAMSVSANSTATRYMGGCETNGDRVEIIREQVVEYILGPLVREWRATVGEGKAPEYVYYFRDGVSSSEYQRILEEEVPSIRFAIAHACGMPVWGGKMCVVVANKRHHLRAFPDPKNRSAADPNGAPLPGTLIDRDVTSPHDWDFLLYTHIALQGTPHPVHYHVLQDEIGLKPNDLANMINDHCYQYIRSTTSVSVHPAIYYAHLISVRARHHEDVPITSGPQSGPEVKMTNPKPKEPRAKRLLPMEGTSNRLALGMWYI